jgi:hypothetical protein
LNDFFKKIILQNAQNATHLGLFGRCGPSPCLLCDAEDYGGECEGDNDDSNVEEADEQIDPCRQFHSIAGVLKNE